MLQKIFTLLASLLLGGFLGRWFRIGDRYLIANKKPASNRLAGFKSAFKEDVLINLILADVEVDCTSINRQIPNKYQRIPALGVLTILNLHLKSLKLRK